jgi:hypothetical protein
MTAVRRLLVVLAVLLAFTACGDDDDRADPGTPAGPNADFGSDEEGCPDDETAAVGDDGEQTGADAGSDDSSNENTGDDSPDDQGTTEEDCPRDTGGGIGTDDGSSNSPDPSGEGSSTTTP